MGSKSKDERMPIDLASRIRGSFIGLAVCDALGGPVEFKVRGSYPLHTEMTYNGNFRLEAGSWTDDTSTALCLTESLLEYKGDSNIGDQVERYIAWWKEGYLSVNGKCFDIGGLTHDTLAFWKKELEKAGYHKMNSESKQARDLLLCTQSIVSSTYSFEPACQTPRAGNGSLMRIVPVALISKDDALALTLARECSQTTHPNVLCSDCCEIYVDIVRMALNGASKEDMAATMCKWAENEEVDSVITNALRKYKTLKEWAARPEKSVQSEGYVVYALECAFWALCCTNTFEEGAIKVVNLGYDTDTNGAIYGGLAGAYYGYEAIPKRWLRKMQKMEMLENMVDGMVVSDGDDFSVLWFSSLFLRIEAASPRITSTTPPQITDIEAELRLDVHARVYTSADEYGIVGLERQAGQKFVELAFKSPAYFYRKPFFAKTLHYVLEHPMFEKDLDPTAVHTKHGILLEVVGRLLQNAGGPIEGVSHLKLLADFEPMAVHIAGEKSAKVAIIRGMYQK